MNATDEFISYLNSVSAKTKVASYEKDVQSALVDYCAVALAGLKDLCSNAKTLNMAKNLYRGSSSDRAFLFGLAAHRLELDDGYREGGVHIGAPLFSALIALRVDSSWVAFAESVMLGYEAIGKIAKNMQPNHKRKGFHSTGTCGCIGSALACSRLQNQNKFEQKISVSSAAAMAAGLLEMQENSSLLKPISAANAASRGVLASQIAKMGLTCPYDAIGGERGFMRTMEGNPDSIEFEGPLVIKSVYKKLYPSCRHGHSAIDAALIIANSERLNYRKIRSIEISTYRDAIFGHDSKTVSRQSEAAMSIPFCVASALIDGSFTLESFNKERLLRDDLNQLMSKITIIEDKELSERAPNERGSRLTIRTNEGAKISKLVMSPKGEPENPISVLDLKKKSVSLFRYIGMDEEKASSFFNKLYVWDGALTELRSLFCREAERVME